jgi:hypothetical protein
MTRATTFVTVLLVLAPAFAGDDDRFCAPLSEVIASAEQRDGLAAITGVDAGMYHETTTTLPGTTFCFSSPNDYPEATWRCLAGSQAKYTLALQLHGTVESRVESCLGSEWTSETKREGAYLMQTIFTQEGNPVRVEVATTKQVTPSHGWRSHRVVVVVYSPRVDAAAASD